MHIWSAVQIEVERGFPESGWETRGLVPKGYTVASLTQQWEENKEPKSEMVGMGMTGMRELVGGGPHKSQTMVVFEDKVKEYGHNSMVTGSHWRIILERMT